MLPLTWDGSKNIAGNEWAPTVKTRVSCSLSLSLSRSLSLFLSLFSQCSTAVLLCTCPDRLGESHNKFELTRNINSLHHRHLRAFPLSAPGTELLCEVKLLNPLWRFQTDGNTFAVQESNQGLSLSRAFFCLKVTFPATNCSAQTEQSEQLQHTVSLPLLTQLYPMSFY